MSIPKSFWLRVTHSAAEPPIPGQCNHVYPSSRSRCGQPVSDRHGDGKWCWSHRKTHPDGTRGAGPRDEVRKANKELTTQARGRRRKDERVLRHLTDGAQAIAPCPDDGSAFPPYVELASEFRSLHKRWPLWWEMAKAIHSYETGES